MHHCPFVIDGQNVIFKYHGLWRSYVAMRDPYQQCRKLEIFQYVVRLLEFSTCLTFAKRKVCWPYFKHALGRQISSIVLECTIGSALYFENVVLWFIHGIKILFYNRERQTHTYSDFRCDPFNAGYEKSLTRWPLHAVATESFVKRHLWKSFAHTTCMKCWAEFCSGRNSLRTRSAVPHCGIIKSRICDIQHPRPLRLEPGHFNGGDLNPCRSSFFAAV